MREILRTWTAIIVVSVWVVASPTGLPAQDFYKDKTIRFIVGYSAGGSFDLYTRVIARHFSKHVPGNPTTVVENMTGAGGILRKAFADSLKDPDLLAEAQKASLDIQYVSGEEAAAVVQGLFKIEPAFIARMKQVLVP